MKRTAAIATLALAASVGLALSSASATVRPTPPDTISHKGKLVSDGVLTPGQLETVRVTKLPAKMKLRVDVDPRRITNCGGVGTAICISAPIPPAPGTPRFRTDSKGRATLTFLVPDHYDSLNTNNQNRTPIVFTNGQNVLVSASGIHREILNGRKELIFSFAQGGAVVQTSQATPAP